MKFHLSSFVVNTRPTMKKWTVSGRSETFSPLHLYRAVIANAPKKTALGWHSYAPRQSDAHQLGRQSLQCSWTSSLELSADGPQTAGLVIRQFRQSLKTFLFGQWDHSAVWIPLYPFNCALEIPITRSLTYLLTCLLELELNLESKCKTKIKLRCIYRFAPLNDLHRTAFVYMHSIRSGPVRCFSATGRHGAPHN